MKLLAAVVTTSLLFLFFSFSSKPLNRQSWIRINLLGYKPNSVKVAVWCSKEEANISTFQLVNADNKQVIFTAPAGKAFGAYGPFSQTYRLDFSVFSKPGKYMLRVGETESPVFFVKEDVYKGAADFCLRYMRQQRTGFNPFLKDSCHTHDGYVLYGSKAGIKDSTHIDVVGGWHDASDYLQYSTTSANATYHLLMAYRDYPQVFGDQKLANGLEGKNGIPDILDEAVWGLKWLQKMNPRQDWMFNQVADDRDHISMRIPKQDSQYGRGYERPVYFVTGEPQQRGKFMNSTTGTSSIAGKFASTFALAQSLLAKDPVFRKADKTHDYNSRALAAYQYGLKNPGYTQTTSVASPYIYAEENWVDDMELGAAAIDNMLKTSAKREKSGYLTQSLIYAAQEKVTPWLGGDTAKHYQWYPFINVGHHELAKDLQRDHSKEAAKVIGYYREGIERVWQKAKQNAFFRAIPFIWCSNNLTTSFATQCLWYRQLSGNNEYEALEQANFDWLFGCNPWGSSFVCGLPDGGDTPTDPHSAFSHILHAPLDGALVDGPVYGSIFKGLIGLKLYNEDSYLPFQSTLAVYHDDYGDYSSNEPTMDGTASLIYLLAAVEADKAAIIRSPHNVKKKP